MPYAQQSIACWCSLYEDVVKHALYKLPAFLCVTVQALPLDTSSSDRLLSEDCCIPSGSNSSALDSDADSDRSDSFKHTLSSSVAASGTHRSGMSFTAKSCHDSVRVVIPDSIADRGRCCRCGARSLLILCIYIWIACSEGEEVSSATVCISTGWQTDSRWIKHAGSS